MQRNICGRKQYLSVKHPLGARGLARIALRARETLVSPAVTGGCFSSPSVVLAPGQLEWEPTQRCYPLDIVGWMPPTLGVLETWGTG